MRLHKIRREYGCEINVAPLIDVVFLLIIFFLTVSHITRVGVELLELPAAQQGEKTDQLAGTRLIINVHKDGRVVIASRTYTLPAIARFLAEETGRAGAGSLSVLIRGDREVRWAAIAEIMGLCTDRGISQVEVAVVEPGPGSSDL